MEYSNKVRSIIASVLNIPVESVSDDLSIGDIEQWDSMGNMAIIAAIEEQMDVEIPLDDLFELNSVKTIEAEIEKLKS